MPEKEKKNKRFTPVIEEIVQDTPPAESILEEKEEKPQNAEKESEKVENTEETPVVESKPQEKKESQKGFSFNLSFFVITVLVAIFVAIFSGGLYVYFNGISSLKSEESEPTPTEEPQPSQEPQATPSGTPSPSATPAPKIDTLKVSILNGSGKIGEAGKAKALLEKAGFKVTQTGNAQNFNFTDTLVQFKSIVSSAAQKTLQDSLKAGYSVKVGDALDSKSSFDIIVTVGSKAP
jgi:hypothetical protein